MKILLLLLLLIGTAHAEDFDVDNFLRKTYIKIGAGYKIQESNYWFHDADGGVYKFDDPISARIEIGYYLNKNLSFGVSHHSQWFSGYPYDDALYEPYKTEIFVDYTFFLSD